MKVKLAAAILGSSMALAGAAISVAADTSATVDSGTTVSGSTSAVCASQSTLVQVNGSSLVDRTDSACLP